MTLNVQVLSNSSLIVTVDTTKTSPDGYGFSNNGVTGQVLQSAGGANSVWANVNTLAANLSGYGIKVATQSEAQIGSDNEAAMTPLRTKQAIDEMTMSSYNLAGITAPTSANNSSSDENFSNGSFWYDNSTKIGWDCSFANSTTASWGPRVVPKISGQIYSTYTGQGATGTPAANTLYVYLWHIRQKITITGPYIRVQTGSGTGGEATVGLWRANTQTIRPYGNALITVSGLQLNTASQQTGSNTITIDPGLYFWGYKANNASATIICLSQSDYTMEELMGRSSATQVGSTAFTGLSKTEAYSNTMPDLTSATWSDVTTSLIPIIRIGV